MTTGHPHSLGQDEMTLLEELRQNGPLLGNQIPAEPTNKLGFNQKTLETLVRRGIAVQINVKGNPGFYALRTIGAPPGASVG